MGRKNSLIKHGKSKKDKDETWKGMKIKPINRRKEDYQHSL